MAGLGTGTPIVKVYHEKSMILPDVSRVLACLYEKDINFERHTASYKSLLRLQASSHAPVPFYDGTKFLEESREICRYIAETYEHHGYQFLLGKDALERASIEQWLHHEEHAFNPPSQALFCHLAFPLDEEDEDIEMQKTKLGEVLEVYDQRLSDSKFLAGNRFTLADLVHLPNSHHITASEFVYLYDSRKNVQRWWNDISTRNSWKQVLRDMTRVEERHKLEKLEKQKQQQQWQREHQSPTGCRTRLDTLKRTGTKPHTTILVPPPAGTVSTSPVAPQAEQPHPTDSLLDSQKVIPQKQPPTEDPRFAASTLTKIYFDDQDIPKKSKHTASGPRQMEAQDSFEETNGGESALPREQPSDILRAASLSSRQAEAKCVHSPTPSSQEGYAVAQADSKQPGDPGSIPRRIIAQDARVTFVESKATDSTSTREQPSDAWQVEEEGPLPGRRVYDVHSTTSTFQDTTRKSEDITAMPQQMAGQDAKDTYEETKFSDSASPQVQPLHYQRTTTPFQKQEVDDPHRTTTPFQKKDPELENTIKPIKDNIPMSWDVKAQDTEGTFKETKIPDSSAYSMPELDSRSAVVDDKATTHARDSQGSYTWPDSAATTVNAHSTNDDELVTRYLRDQGAQPPALTQAQPPPEFPANTALHHDVSTHALDKYETKSASTNQEGITPTAVPAASLESQLGDTLAAEVIQAEQKSTLSEQELARATQDLSPVEPSKETTDVSVADQTKAPQKISRQQAKPSPPITREVPTSYLRDQGAQPPPESPADTALHRDVSTDALDKYETKSASTNQEGITPTAVPAASLESQLGGTLAAEVVQAEQKSTLSEQESARATQDLSPVEPSKEATDVSVADQTKSPQKISRQQAKPSAPITREVATSYLRDQGAHQPPESPADTALHHDVSTHALDKYETKSASTNQEGITPTAVPAASLESQLGGTIAAEVVQAEQKSTLSEQESARATQDLSPVEPSKEATDVSVADQTKAPQKISRQETKPSAPITREVPTSYLRDQGAQPPPESLADTALHRDVSTHAFDKYETKSASTNEEGITPTAVPAGSLESQLGGTLAAEVVQAEQKSTLSEQESARATQDLSPVEPSKEATDVSVADQTKSPQKISRQQAKPSAPITREVATSYLRDQGAHQPPESPADTALHHDVSTHALDKYETKSASTNQEGITPTAVPAASLESQLGGTLAAEVVQAEQKSTLSEQESARATQDLSPVEPSKEATDVSVADQTKAPQKISRQETKPSAPITREVPTSYLRDQGAQPPPESLADTALHRDVSTHALDKYETKSASTNQEGITPTAVPAASLESQLGGTIAAEVVQAEQKSTLSVQESARATQDLSPVEPSKEATDVSVADQTKAPQKISRQQAKPSPPITREVPTSYLSDQGAQPPPESPADTALHRDVSTDALDKYETKSASTNQEGITPTAVPAASLESQLGGTLAAEVVQAEQKSTLSVQESARATQDLSPVEPSKEATDVSVADQTKAPQKISRQQAKPSPPITREVPTSYLRDQGAQPPPESLADTALHRDVSTHALDKYETKSASTNEEGITPTAVPAASLESQLGGTLAAEVVQAEQKSTLSEQELARAAQDLSPVEPSKEATDVSVADQTKAPQKISRQQAKPSPPITREVPTSYLRDQGAQPPPESPADTALHRDVSTDALDKYETKSASTNQEGITPTAVPAASLESQLGGTLAAEVVQAEQKSTLSEQESARATQDLSPVEPSKEATDVSVADQTKAPQKISRQETKPSAPITREVPTSYLRDQGAQPPPESLADTALHRDVSTHALDKYETKSASTNEEGITPTAVPAASLESQLGGTIAAEVVQAEQKSTLSVQESARATQDLSPVEPSKEATDVSVADQTKAPQKISRQQAKPSPPITREVPTSYLRDQGAQPPPEYPADTALHRDVSTDALDKYETKSASTNEEGITPTAVPAASLESQLGGTLAAEVVQAEQKSTVSEQESARATQDLSPVEPSKEATDVSVADQTKAPQKISRQETKPSAPITREVPTSYLRDQGAQPPPESLADTALHRDVSTHAFDKYETKSASTNQEGITPTAVPAASLESQLGGTLAAEVVQAEQKSTLSEQESARATQDLSPVEPSKEATDVSVADQTKSPQKISRQQAKPSAPITREVATSYLRDQGAHQRPESPADTALHHDVSTHALDKYETKSASTNQEGITPTAVPAASLESQLGGTIAAEVVQAEQKSTLSVQESARATQDLSPVEPSKEATDVSVADQTKAPQKISRQQAKPSPPITREVPTSYLRDQGAQPPPESPADTALHRDVSTDALDKYETKSASTNQEGITPTAVPAASLESQLGGTLAAEVVQAEQKSTLSEQESARATQDLSPVEPSKEATDVSVADQTKAPQKISRQETKPSAPITREVPTSYLRDQGAQPPPESLADTALHRDVSTHAFDKYETKSASTNQEGITPTAVPAASLESQLGGTIAAEVVQAEQKSTLSVQESARATQDLSPVEPSKEATDVSVADQTKFPQKISRQQAKPSPPITREVPTSYLRDQGAQPPPESPADTALHRDVSTDALDKYETKSASTNQEGITPTAVPAASLESQLGGTLAAEVVQAEQKSTLSEQESARATQDLSPVEPSKEATDVSVADQTKAPQKISRQQAKPSPPITREVPTSYLRDHGAQPPPESPADTALHRDVSTHALDKYETKSASTNQEGITPTAVPAASLESQLGGTLAAEVVQAEQKSTLSEQESARATQDLSPVEPIKEATDVSVADQTKSPQKISHQQAKPSAPITREVATSYLRDQGAHQPPESPADTALHRDVSTHALDKYETKSASTNQEGITPTAVPAASLESQLGGTIAAEVVQAEQKSTLSVQESARATQDLSPVEPRKEATDVSVADQTKAPQKISRQQAKPSPPITREVPTSYLRDQGAQPPPESPADTALHRDVSTDALDKYETKSASTNQEGITPTAVPAASLESQLGGTLAAEVVQAEQKSTLSEQESARATQDLSPVEPSKEATDVSVADQTKAQQKISRQETKPSAPITREVPTSYLRDQGAQPPSESPADTALHRDVSTHALDKYETKSASTNQEGITPTAVPAASLESQLGGTLAAEVVQAEQKSTLSEQESARATQDLSPVEPSKEATDVSVADQTKAPQKISRQQTKPSAPITREVPTSYLRDQGAQPPPESPADTALHRDVSTHAFDKYETKSASTNQEGITPTAVPAASLESQLGGTLAAEVVQAEQKSTLSEQESARATQDLSPVEPSKEATDVSVADQTKAPQKISRQQTKPSAPITREVPPSYNQGVISNIQERELRQDEKEPAEETEAQVTVADRPGETDLHGNINQMNNVTSQEEAQDQSGKEASGVQQEVSNKNDVPKSTEDTSSGIQAYDKSGNSLVTPEEYTRQPQPEGNVQGPHANFESPGPPSNDETLTAPTTSQAPTPGAPQDGGSNTAQMRPSTESSGKNDKDANGVSPNTLAPPQDEKEPAEETEAHGTGTDGPGETDLHGNINQMNNVTSQEEAQDQSGKEASGVQQEVSNKNDVPKSTEDTSSGIQAYDKSGNSLVTPEEYTRQPQPEGNVQGPHANFESPGPPSNDETLTAPTTSQGPTPGAPQGGGSNTAQMRPSTESSGKNDKDANGVSPNTLAPPQDEKEPAEGTEAHGTGTDGPGETDLHGNINQMNNVTSQEEAQDQSGKEASGVQQEVSNKNDVPKSTEDTSSGLQAYDKSGNSLVTPEEYTRQPQPEGNVQGPHANFESPGPPSNDETLTAPTTSQGPTPGAPQGGGSNTAQMRPSTESSGKDDKDANGVSPNTLSPPQDEKEPAEENEAQGTGTDGPGETDLHGNINQMNNVTSQEEAQDQSGKEASGVRQEVSNKNDVPKSTEDTSSGLQAYDKSGNSLVTPEEYTRQPQPEGNVQGPHANFESPGPPSNDETLTAPTTSQAPTPGAPQDGGSNTAQMRPSTESSGKDDKDANGVSPNTLAPPQDEKEPAEETEAQGTGTDGPGETDLHGNINQMNNVTSQEEAQDQSGKEASGVRQEVSNKNDVPKSTEDTSSGIQAYDKSGNSLVTPEEYTRQPQPEGNVQGPHANFESPGPPSNDETLTAPTTSQGPTPGAPQGGGSNTAQMRPSTESSGKDDKDANGVSPNTLAPPQDEKEPAEETEAQGTGTDGPGETDLHGNINQMNNVTSQEEAQDQSGKEASGVQQEVSNKNDVPKSTEDTSSGIQAYDKSGNSLVTPEEYTRQPQPEGNVQGPHANFESPGPPSNDETLTAPTTSQGPTPGSPQGGGSNTAQMRPSTESSGKDDKDANGVNPNTLSPPQDEKEPAEETEAQGTGTDGPGETDLHGNINQMNNGTSQEEAQDQSGKEASGVKQEVSNKNDVPKSTKDPSSGM